MCKIMNSIKNILIMLNISIVIFIIGIFYFNDKIYVSANEIEYNEIIEECKATYKEETVKGYNVEKYIPQSITSVKNQGETGLCWSYAAISAIESSMIKCNNFS